MRWRALRSDGVSPLRVSTRIGRPISSIGPIRLRWTSTAERFQRRDVEGVEALGGVVDRGRRSSAGSRPASCPRRSRRRAGRGRRRCAASSMSSWCRRGAQPRAANQSLDDGRAGAALRCRHSWRRGPRPGNWRAVASSVDVLADPRRAVAQDDPDEQHEQDDRPDDRGDAPADPSSCMTTLSYAGREPPGVSGAITAHMARLGTWIEPFPEGIYVKPADAWVDPSQPKERALVTHGHADHARGGHGAVWATPETLAIMDVRYGQQTRQPGRLMARACGSARSRSASSPPAMCWDRRRSCSIIAASGWSCRAITSAAPTRPARRSWSVPCDIFITEATFGLPVFRHPDTGSEIDRLLHRLHARAGAVRAGRRLCAGQGAAGDRRAARARA